MSNPSGDKGAKFERLIVDHLVPDFPRVERSRNKGGSKDDTGDLVGLPHLTIEAKNHKRMELAGWLEEARLESCAAGTEFYVVVHKRRGVTAAGQQYATTTLDNYLALYRFALGMGHDRVQRANI